MDAGTNVINYISGKFNDIRARVPVNMDGFLSVGARNRTDSGAFEERLAAAAAPYDAGASATGEGIRFNAVIFPNIIPAPAEEETIEPDETPAPGGEAPVGAAPVEAEPGAPGAPVGGPAPQPSDGVGFPQQYEDGIGYGEFLPDGYYTFDYSFGDDFYEIDAGARTDGAAQWENYVAGIYDDADDESVLEADDYSVDAPGPSGLSEAIESSIVGASARYGIDANLIRAIIRQESDFSPASLSSSGAQGLMQLMPGTAESLGVTDPWDIDQNIDGGARYLRSQLENYSGDLALALAAYNAGPGAVRKYGGVPPYEETRNYIEKVVGYYEKYTRDER